jgi:hypothetical protein
VIYVKNGLNPQSPAVSPDDIVESTGIWALSSSAASPVQLQMRATTIQTPACRLTNDQCLHYHSSIVGQHAICAEISLFKCWLWTKKTKRVGNFQPKRSLPEMVDSPLDSLQNLFFNNNTIELDNLSEYLHFLPDLQEAHATLNDHLHVTTHCPTISNPHYIRYTIGANFICHFIASAHTGRCCPGAPLRVPWQNLCNAQFSASPYEVTCKETRVSASRM